jgi:glycosyltransferase involved in cell wall biosynthesis
MKRRPSVMYAVTVSESIKLMRGQLDYLRKEGYDVHLISSPGEEVLKGSINEGIENHFVSMEREISPIRDFVSLLKLIRLFLRVNPDLSNVGTPKAGFLAGLAALITRVPRRIYTLRGLRLETTKGFKRLILNYTEKISCLCAHQVICISKSLRDQAVELGIVDYDKTIVLGEGSSNGVDMSRFDLTVNLNNDIYKIRENLNLPKNSIIIGFVGRFTKDKGIVELIEAYRKIKMEIEGVKLLLVGKFEEGDPIPFDIVDFILNDPNIILTGYVEDSVPYYFCMNVLAFPTYREGFGNTSIEAAAAGIPVVTTNATGSVDTVIHNKTGYIVPVGRVDLLADSILELLLNQEKARLFGQAGKERAEEEFKSEVIWGKLNQLYQEHLKLIK